MRHNNIQMAVMCECVDESSIVSSKDENRGSLNWNVVQKGIINFAKSYRCFNHNWISSNFWSPIFDSISCWYPWRWIKVESLTNIWENSKKEPIRKKKDTKIYQTRSIRRKLVCKHVSERKRLPKWFKCVFIVPFKFGTNDFSQSVLATHTSHSLSSFRSVSRPQRTHRLRKLYWDQVKMSLEFIITYHYYYYGWCCCCCVWVGL